MDGDERECAERAKVGLLALRLLRVAGMWPDSRSEVPHGAQPVVRHKSSGEGHDIEPLVRRPLEGAVVQVEPVDIDDGSGHGGEDTTRSSNH